jgi:DNA-binding MarR family transcriptional regulator
MNDEELRILIQKVARRIRNNRASDDLGDSQLGVLFRLEGGDQSPGELAAHERVTPPSMNRTLNGLEQAGLVARHPAIEDARRVRVSLTPAGRAQIAETRALRTAWFSQRVADLTADERRALLAVTPILRRLADE